MNRACSLRRLESLRRLFSLNPVEGVRPPTLPAFAAAMAAGAHEIEFDLWASRDDVLVVCHDAAVDRTTDGRGKVAELTWEEIRGLDAGIRLGDAWRGVRIPRLEEVLASTRAIAPVGPERGRPAWARYAKSIFIRRLEGLDLVAETA